MSTLAFNFQKTPLARTLGVAKYCLRLAAALAPRYQLAFLVRDGDPVDALVAAGVEATAGIFPVRPDQKSVDLAIDDAVEIRAHHFQPALTSLPSAVVIHDFHVFHVPWKYPDPQAMQRLLVECSEHADAVVTEFPYTYFHFTRYTGLPSNKLFWAGAALLVDGQPIETSDAIERVRAISSKKILYPAQLQQHKNHVPLIQALAIVNERLPVSLLLTGTEFDTEYAKAIEIEVEHAGLNDRVIHLGNLSDAELLAIYDLVDATVIPSLAEGGAYVPLESLARGTPVATSMIESALYHLRSSGVHDEVVYFDPAQPREIAAAIQLALSRSEKERRRPTALSVPTWQDVADNWSAVIEWLLGRRPRPFVQIDAAFRLVGIADE